MDHECRSHVESTDGKGEYFNDDSLFFKVRRADDQICYCTTANTLTRVPSSQPSKSFVSSLFLSHVTTLAAVGTVEVPVHYHRL